VSQMTQDEAERLSALLQQGLALHQAGRLAEAAIFYTQVLERFPDHPDTLDLYGVLLLQAGDNIAAAEVLERAVTARPDDAGFLNHLGACRRALGQLDEARAAFETARSLRPDMPEATFNLATVLNQLGQYTEAEDAARDAANLSPGSIEARLLLVVILKRLGRSRDALTELLEARTVNPLDSRVHLQIAQSFSTQGQVPDAAKAARLAMLLQPEISESYVFLGETDNILEWSRRAIRIAPDDGRLWASLSSRHDLVAENHASIEAAKRAMLLQPAIAIAYISMTTCSVRLYQSDQAIAAAYRGLAINSNLHILAIGVSEYELSRGNIAKGWEFYERRLLLPDAYPRLGLPPAWDREAPPVGPLLVCAEQGVGDEFVFLSCLPDLLAVASDVIVECDSRTKPLFERSYPSVRWIPRVVRATRAGSVVWDYRDDVPRLAPSEYIMSASLMGLFGAGMGRPATKGGYLRVDPTESEIWRAWLASRGDSLKVGLCWRSGMVDVMRQEFYVTPSMLLDGLGAKTSTYISLMYVDAGEEIASIRRTHGITIHEPPNINQRDELDRLAALISELDIVVTVDTSVCAMAAACGIPTIRLEASYLMLANGRDALFDNLYPCRDTESAFSRSDALARASAKLKEWRHDLESNH
jgi:Flp pilus assembly protein TadD